MRNRLTTLALMGLMIAGSAAPALGLEVQRGKLKVLVADRTGRLSVWASEDTVKPVWTALFSTEDPSTTKWKVQIGEKAYVLGEDASLTTAVESTTTGLKTTWTGKTFIAVLTLDFVLSTSASVPDGLRLGLTVTNTTEAAYKVAARWLLDTSIGEKAGDKKEHFRLPSGDSVTSEQKIDTNVPDWWASRAAAEDPPGLLVMAGKGGTAPSKIYFSNWKRLDDAAWEPPFKQGRDFNLLPYSFNDSAVASFFDAQEVSPGSSREIVVLMGLSNAQSFAGARVASANPLDDLLKKNQDPTRSALDQDLASLDTLVGQLDAKLTDPGKVSPEDLKLLQAVLDQIEVRKNTLTASKTTTP